MPSGKWCRTSNRFHESYTCKCERRWTAIEKECYDLHMTLKKFEYLLRDVPFTLYTDHANLVYLNVPPSNKVLRWKMAM